MLSRRITSILPELTFEESLEITKIYSVAGLLTKNTSIITKRPFRSPHHTISPASLIGGGKIPKPGEISLAHYGVLFLDELPEFNKNTLEMLREPIEEGKITISRSNSAITYPSKFIFIASMNPCKCGYYGSEIKECRCSKKMIERYMGKISGPLLDRIDIQVEVFPVKYNELNSNKNIESSKAIKKRINIARNTQINRYKEIGIHSNSELNSCMIKKYCELNKSSKKILRDAFEKLGLSVRSYERIIKVSRTIADLEQKENIEEKHIAEAIQYRCLDRMYLKNKR